MVKNAPGGKISKAIGLKFEEMGNPNIFPEPSSSRIKEIKIKAKVKPIPVPRPSAMDLITVLLEANESALWKIMQLTTIKGMNIPKLFDKVGL